MKPKRQLALYDGQRRVGSITGSDDSFAAKDARGVKLGEFATVQRAVDAINKSDVGQHAKSAFPPQRPFKNFGRLPPSFAPHRHRKNAARSLNWFGARPI